MAAKKTSPKNPSKSAFIRSQPPTMSAKEIVDKAKAQGIKLSGNLVYMVRGPRRSAKSSAKKGVAKAASTPASPAIAHQTSTPKKATSGPVNKASFVRQHAGLSPKEIVSAAKAQGIDLDVGYVYNVRGQAKTAVRKATPAASSTGATPKPSAAKSSAAAPARPVNSSVEELLKAVAAEVGLGRALEILQSERARVRAVMGG